MDNQIDPSEVPFRGESTQARHPSRPDPGDGEPATGIEIVEWTF